MTFTLYFTPQLMAKLTRWVREHFVTLIEVGMHLIELRFGFVGFFSRELMQFSAKKLQKRNKSNNHIKKRSVLPVTVLSRK